MIEKINPKKKEGKMNCKICGDEKTTKFRGRWWDPDDGWRFGTLCEGCWMLVRKEVPKPEDFAYNKRNELDVDDFIDNVMG